MQRAALLFCAATVALSAQTFTTLASFSGSNSAGSQMGPIIQGADGNLYGTTQGAGANNHGSVFEITPAGNCNGSVQLRLHRWWNACGTCTNR